MSVRVTILGCGSSGGVPRVGQGWGACDPTEPRNRRRRCSILVEKQGPGGTTTVLVDTSPDVREQLLGAGIQRLDAVILTHDHADHTHGIDDLRPLTIHNRQRIPVFAHAQTMQSVIDRFGYCFVSVGDAYPPILDLHEVPLAGEFSLSGPGGAIVFSTDSVLHGTMEVLALRFNDIAYTPDISTISHKNMQFLSGLDTWIVDALRLTPHPTHFSLSDALHWIGELKPRHAILTNLHTDLDYRQLLKTLPKDVTPAYDGMCFVRE